MSDGIIYNEIDPYCARWLGNLADAGELPVGHIDTRSIVDLEPADLDGYRQCHFFAGIGGWAYALKLAGWPEDREVWTGSCPCQPLSSAGRRQGHADERHLWPAFYRLIAERRPATVFGEQVAGGLGREWLAGVRADLEDIGYAVGAADLCAAGIGAPHIRQRLYWVANASGERIRQRSSEGFGAPEAAEGQTRQRQRGRLHAEPSGEDDIGLANSDRGSGQEREHQGVAAPEGAPIRDCARERDRVGQSAHCLADGSNLANPERIGQSRPCGRVREHGDASRGPDAGNSGFLHGLGNTIGPRLEERPDERRDREPERKTVERTGGNAWAGAEWLACLDSKARRTQPGIFPLADGLPLAVDGLGPVSRIGTLRGAGNAIVPELAAVFVRAFLGKECAT